MHTWAGAADLMCGQIKQQKVWVSHHGVLASTNIEVVARSSRSKQFEAETTHKCKDSCKHAQVFVGG